MSRSTFLNLNGNSASIIQNHVRRILACMEKPHLHDIQSALVDFVDLTAVGIVTERQSESLNRLSTKWSNRLAVVSEDDLADVQFLLFTYPSDVHIAPVRQNELSLKQLDQIRFGTMALAAMTRSVPRVANLLGLELYDSALMLEAAFSECWMLKKGTDLQLRDGRSEAEVVVELLQSCLDENPLPNLVFGLGSNPSLVSLRFALIGLLARSVAAV